MEKQWKSESQRRGGDEGVELAHVEMWSEITEKKREIRKKYCEQEKGGGCGI